MHRPAHSSPQESKVLEMVLCMSLYATITRRLRVECFITGTHVRTHHEMAGPTLAFHRPIIKVHIMLVEQKVDGLDLD